MSDALINVIRAFVEGINLFFIFYLIGYSIFLFLSVVIGATTLYNRRREEKFKNTFSQDYYIPISIIVPAYNEEVTVVETIKSLLQLQYRSYEIIVVDDGSKDKTSQQILEAFRMFHVRRPIRSIITAQKVNSIYESHEYKVPITLIRKKNGGKADALNTGINACRFPYFVCMDADSVLQYDSLQKIVQPILKNNNVVAVGGSIRASNSVELEGGRVKEYRMPKNLLAYMQVLEYDRSFLASRILFDKFNGSMILSGAFALFKKDVVIDAGGYDNTSLGEDMELVVKLHEYCLKNKIPYLIEYATDAICWTQVPEKMSDLKRQRKRWHLGLFQSMWKYRNMFMNPDFGMLSMISYLYFFIYELMSPFIELLGIVAVILSHLVDMLNYKFMILFLGVYTIFSVVMSLTSFFARVYTIELSITLKDALKAPLLSIIEIAFLRLRLAFVRMTSLLGYRKETAKWGRIERKKIDFK